MAEKKGQRRMLGSRWDGRDDWPNLIGEELP